MTLNFRKLLLVKSGFFWGGISIGSQKLWFLLRMHGVEALQEKIRLHITASQRLSQRLAQHPHIILTIQSVLSLFSFRATIDQADLETHNNFNRELLNRINNSGQTYLSGTMLDDTFVIRFVSGSWLMRLDDVDIAYQCITTELASLQTH